MNGHSPKVDLDATVHPCGPRRARVRAFTIVLVTITAGLGVALFASHAFAHAPDAEFSAHADAVLKARPCDIGVRMARARRAIDAGNRALAHRDLAAVERCVPHADAAVHAERARLAQRSGALTLAIRNASRARQLEPENAAYIFLLGTLQAQAGEQTLAARTLDDAYRRAPSPDVALARIRLARDSGRPGEALHLSTSAWADLGAVPALVRAALGAARATGRYRQVHAAIEAAHAASLAPATRSAFPPRYALYGAELAMRDGDRERARTWLDRFAAASARAPQAARALAQEYRRCLGPIRTAKAL